MKSYLNSRNKKEIKNPIKLSFTLEWSIKDIQEMTENEETKGQIKDLIMENQERFMELMASIADSYLTEAVSSNGSRPTPSILYSIADDMIRGK